MVDGDDDTSKNAVQDPGLRAGGANMPRSASQHVIRGGSMQGEALQVGRSVGLQGLARGAGGFNFNYNCN